MSREHHLSIAELGTGFIHQSRLALVVLPLLESGQHDLITVEYAHEFADALNTIFFQEGQPALNFINDLKKEEQEKIISVLQRGGMAGSDYRSGDVIFSVPDLTSK